MCWTGIAIVPVFCHDRKMRRKRRYHSASFRAEVAGAAVRGRRPLPKLVQQYDVHPNQIQNWRSQQVNNAERLFERGAWT